MTQSEKIERPTKSPRGRPRSDVARLAVQDDLLQAASDLMIERDTIDISLSEIGDRAGLSGPLAIYYFGSKEGLLLALVERNSMRAVEQMAEVTAMPISADKKLKMHIAGLVNAYFRYPYVNRLLQMLMHSSPESAERVSEVFVRPIANFYRELLEQGEREGIFRQVNPMHFYFILVGACDHLFARRIALAHVFGIEAITEATKKEYAASVIDIILGGIRAPAGR